MVSHKTLRVHVFSPVPWTVQDRRERQVINICKQCLSPAFLTLTLPLGTLHFGETEWGVVEQVNLSSGDREPEPEPEPTGLRCQGKSHGPSPFCVSKLKHLNQPFRNFPSWFSVKYFIGSWMSPSVPNYAMNNNLPVWKKILELRQKAYTTASPWWLTVVAHVY